MVRSGRPDGTDGQQSLGELVALAAKDVSSLVRYEISLAKSELKMDVRRIGIAAALAVVGLFIACLLVVLLCFALAYGLADMYAIPIWAGFVCTFGACVVLIIILALIAFLIVRKVTGMKMTRQTVKDDIGMLRKSESSPNGSGPAVANPEVGAGTTAGIPPARP
ncbi:MAG: phage holin family protein [Trebonia sp.]